jgi:Leucine-rich repeat (LRR) protein
MGELSKELLEKQDENGEIRHIKVIVLQNNGLKDIHVVTKLLPLAHGLVFLSLADNDISSISGLTDVLPESLIILDLSENEISDIDSLIVPRNVEMVIVNKNRIPEGGTLHYIDQLKVFRENNPNANIHMYDMA